MIGEKAASSPLTGNILLKHALIDVIKKVNANMNGINLMLPQFSEPNKQLLKIPIGLCMRGALSDSLTGIYLFTFSDDPISTENEINVLSKDYARYLKDTEEYILQYGDGLNKEEIETQLRVWIGDFKAKYPKLFKSSTGNEWDLKKGSELRQGSKYRIDNTQTSDKDKFEWIRNCPGGEKYISLYVLIKYFSQHQHYGFANRSFIDDLPEEDFKRLVVGTVVITEVVWAFAHALDQLTEEVKQSYTEIHNKIHSFF